MSDREYWLLLPHESIVDESMFDELPMLPPRDAKVRSG